MKGDDDTDEDGSKFVAAIAAATHAIASLELAESQTLELENEVPKSWFWKQTPRRLSFDSDSSDEIEHEAAISAAAFAVATLKEDEAKPHVSGISKTNRRDSNGQHYSNEASTSKMKPEQGPKDWSSQQNTVTMQNTQEAASRPAELPTKADAWEMAAMAKIRKRYEKQYFNIVSREIEMKANARNHLCEIEGRMYLRKATAAEKCEKKVAKIDRKAKRSKERVEQRKQYEISKIKRRENKIKSKDKPSVRCFCF